MTIDGGIENDVLATGQLDVVAVAAKAAVAQLHRRATA